MAVDIFQINVPDPFADIAISKKFLITRGAIQAVKGQIFQLPDYEIEESDLPLSDYGTPVIDNLEILAGKYIDLDGNEIEYSGLTINTVIIEVNQVKNIIKTSVQGRNGTIKEYVSDGDLQINIKGLISNFQNAIPLDELRAFTSIMKVPQQVEVVSQFLNEVHDIDFIVVDSYQMPQAEGKRNEVPFSFQASSDVQLDLEELEFESASDSG